jgi:hypothetical protein
MPLYPDVPRTPGVPAVFRLPGAIETAIVPLLTDAQALLGGQTFPWGVFSADGTPALVPDSVLGVEYREEQSISDYPIEDGGFESYNKVRRPYEARVPMAKGGPSAEREAFLRVTEDLIDSTDLYTVVTPERTYLNANVIGYSYSRRSQEGAQLIIIELQLQEVRIAPSPSYSNTREPSGADAVNDGAVQTAGETVPDGVQAA